MTWPELTKDTVLYTRKEYIADQDQTLRIIDLAKLEIIGKFDIYGTLTINGVVYLPLTDGDHGDITVSNGGQNWQVDPDVITLPELADNSVDTAALVNKSVTAGKIADDTITAAQIAADAITSVELANNSVDTNALVDANVTPAKLSFDVATQAELDAVAGTIAAKANTVRTIVTEPTVATTAALVQSGSYVRFTGASPTYTIPPNATIAFPIGTQIEGTSTAGTMTLIQGAGVILNKARTLVTTAAFSGWTVIKVATNEWDVHGDFV